MSAVPSASKPIDDPRVYLAAERTFLAWIRTSISLMGFGFVIARFALSSALTASRPAPPIRPAPGFRAQSESEWSAWASPSA